MKTTTKIKEVTMSIDKHKNLDFGTAIKNLKMGNKVSRSDVNGGGTYLELQAPDKGSKMTLPYIYRQTSCNNLVPWIPSHADILAEDWEIV